MKRRIVDGAAEYAGAAAGAAAGALCGAVIAGPVGAVGGALAASGVERIMRAVGDEIKKRLLSPSESERIGDVLQEASKLINEKLAQGETLRDDGFFEDVDGERPAAEEILEGTLLAAQSEYEERKLVYLSRLYANIAFHPEVSRAMANRLIKLVEAVTYRQIVILHIVGGLVTAEKEFQGISMRRRGAYTSVSGMENVAIASEVFDLYRMSLLGSTEAILDAAGINPSALTVIGYGAHLYNLMGLERLENHGELQELEKDIVVFLTGSEVVDGRQRAL